MTTARGPGEAPPSPSMLALVGCAYALVGVLLARLVVPLHQAGLAAVALAALGMAETARTLFARHREIAWAAPERVGEASRDLAAGLFALQTGAILGFAAVALRLSGPETLAFFGFQRGVFAYRIVSAPGEFLDLWGAAARAGAFVLCLSLLFGAVLKEGGVALVVAWIGSLWGLSLAFLLRAAGPALTPAAAAAVGASLASASVAFLLAGMSGLFVGRGAQRHPIRSAGYRGIVRTSLRLLSAAAALVAVSSAVTAWNVIEVP